MSLSSAASKEKAIRPTVFQGPLDWRRLLQTLAVLLKLRIVALLLLAAVGGAFLGAGGLPDIGELALLVVAGGMSASGASALNQYLERNTDGDMARTRRRPLVTGAIGRPGLVLLSGSVLVLLPALAVLTINPELAFFLLLGAFIYVGVYTYWLKPRSLLNIVVGGAAGSAAVLSGGAAVGNWGEPAVLVLAGLIFLWTPSHFWSLAILYNKDYRRAGVPMLPARTGARTAAFWVLLHTGATALAAMLLAATPVVGRLYLLLAGLATVDLLRQNVRLIKEPSARTARSLFLASNKYLMIVLLTACIDAAI